MQRWLYRRELERLAGSPVVYLDQCGVDHRLMREWGWAPRGERVRAEVPGRRLGRTSVISAWRDGRLLAPITFQGHCKSALVEAYFAAALLPALAKGTLIVLDNASFHRSRELARLVEEAGCRLLFLPPYSPDLNPIERTWAAFKKLIRKGLSFAQDKFSFITEKCQCYC